MSSRAIYDPRDLSEGLQQKFGQIIERFEDAWRQGSRPEISEYLPDDERMRPAILRRLVHVDLEYRCKSGQQPRSGEYLARYPELKSEIGFMESLDGAIARFESAVESTDPDKSLSTILCIGVVDNQSPAPPKQLLASTNTVERIDRIGEYEIIREIARGGMGVVYEARHLKLGRSVALKLIRSGELASPQEVRRFQMEAEAAAKLDHPGIVPVYEVGKHAGQHFLAMAYVDGQSLWQRVKEAPLEPNFAARLMQQVAEAVHYAHTQGIIHRDLKPQNILLTGEDQPRITDFGLAKNQARDSSLTATGDVLGTPSYMPPEQASGNLHQIGPLADVYSLGATLYCLLVGRPPFQASSSIETLMQVVENDPVPPRQMNRSVPIDLDSVCLKCLEKDPSKRYVSAAALADDLGRFCRNEPVSVSTPNWRGKLLRAVRRNRDDVHLQAYGVILAWIAMIVFLAEFSIQFLGRYSSVIACLTIVRIPQFIAFALVAYSFRREFIGVQHAALSQMWSLWLGFCVACHVDVWARFQQQRLMFPGYRIDQFAVYPDLFVLSGFLFVAIGRQYWGVCYIIGALFFGLAAILPWRTDWSPLIFGTSWGAILGLISWRLRWLRMNTCVNTAESERH